MENLDRLIRDVYNKETSKTKPMKKPEPELEKLKVPESEEDNNETPLKNLRGCAFSLLYSAAKLFGESVVIMLLAEYITGGPIEFFKVMAGIVILRLIKI